MNNDLFSSLDDEKIKNLAYIINSPAYVDFFEPFLRAMERGMLENLVDPAKTRKESQSDDYLRGGIIVIRNLLDAPTFVLEEYRNKAIEDSKLKNDEEFYKERALAGSMGPLPYQRMTDEDIVTPPGDPLLDY